jgi:hypothetical protein
MRRTTEFWGRASKVYLAYKVAQVRAMGLKAGGMSPEDLKEKFWQPHHTWAGKEFYNMAVDLRGFYLKVGPLCARAKPLWTPGWAGKSFHRREGGYWQYVSQGGGPLCANPGSVCGDWPGRKF